MEENNKLIAEFMGWDIQSPTTIPTNLHLSNLELDNAEVMELKFNTSWDWLMPVIEKCLLGEAEQNEEISNTTIKNIYEGIYNQDISFTYKSVIGFIKHYNQNN
jgi:hypothetical protein